MDGMIVGEGEVAVDLQSLGRLVVENVNRGEEYAYGV